MRRNAVLPRNLGKKLKRARREMGITQEELAERANLSRAYIGYIEQGKNLPALQTLEKIAKALKIRLSDLF